jgi:hypothetical protein
MDKKFIKSKKIDDYEVLTDTGWVGIDSIHKTIEYDIWLLETDSYSLECADDHIVFYENYKEVYVKDLKINDIILTENGSEKVINIIKTDKKSSMYDLQLDINSNKRYLTNGILSHNTTYLRYLIRKIKEINKFNNILYFPPTMVDSITDPNFINFISDWVSESEGKNYIIIEDAEPLIESRDSSRNIGITNLLNLTDGLLNDILNVQIIATFNINLKNIDTALLRPERLIARKEFRKLTIDNAKRLADHLSINPELITEEMTLAELYSMKKDSKTIVHDIDNNKSKKIGF